LSSLQRLFFSILLAKEPLSQISGLSNKALLFGPLYRCAIFNPEEVF
jgi:hypothetical protein